MRPVVARIVTSALRDRLIWYLSELDKGGGLIADARFIGDGQTVSEPSDPKPHSTLQHLHSAMHIFCTYTCTLWKRATPSSDARVQHTWTRPMQPMRALLRACTPSPALYLPSLCCSDLQ